MAYRILTNSELNLASSWERWHMERYGNVLVPSSQEPDDPEASTRVAEQVELNHLIETSNL